MTKITNQVTFKAIDIPRHGELACQFREDTFTVSFGDAHRFHEEDGKGSERYLEALKLRITEHPRGHVHVWLKDEIIGQLEARPLPEDPSIGYITLIYLTKPYRAKGYGTLLLRYLESWLQAEKCQTLRLSVTPTNTQALKFYVGHGWIDCGPCPDRPVVHIMEKVIV